LCKQTNRFSYTVASEGELAPKITDGQQGVDIVSHHAQSDFS